MTLAIGVSLAAALVSYHPGDSSAFFTSTNSTIANWIGYYGATVAWVFVSFFGFASVLFPAALLVIGWNRFWGKELEFLQTKLIGFTILALALPPMFDLTVGSRWFRGALVPSGGYLGTEINHAASSNLNATGAAIALITAILIGLLLATRISLGALFLALHRKLLAAGRALTLQWARFTERRRKEKMKDSVLRKHIEKEAPALRLVST
ncbi:MAG TPA: DNA translocase FtsK 4TM domain-containing protein, partial [Thermoanaerobaculia bacterium]